MVAEPLIQTQKSDGIFDDIRNGYKAVAAMAQHVTIHTAKISAYADTLPDQAPENVFDETHHFKGDFEQTAAYTLILDSVNFGSGYEPHMSAEGWELIDHSIYYSLSTRLKQHFENDGPLDAAKLCNFSAEDCLELFALNPSGHYSREFAGLCALSLRELGQVVSWKYGGSFLNFVRAAEGSAEKMVGQLADMHHFNDVHTYRGMNVPFYKRAQITVADLHLAFGQLGEELFADIDKLTMFPDNGVPHVLRMDGIIDYTPELTRRIDNGDEILSGSDEEVEIRACAGQVVELIASHKNMIAMSVDHILWHKSVEESRYREKPSHKTLSQFY